MARIKAERVVLELIRYASEGVWDGKTKLFKGFYFSHLYYAKDEPGILTDWPIVHMPQGPGIHNGDVLLQSLVDVGCITVEVISEGPYPEYRYRLTEKAKTLSRLPGDAVAAIEKSAQFVIPRTAGELSQFTHEHSRAWREGKNGDILDVYIDLIPDEEYEKEQKKLVELDQQLAAALLDSQIAMWATTHEAAG